MKFKDNWYKYFKPLHKSKNMQFNVDCWTKSQNLYDSWDYKKSLLELLKYVDLKIDKKYKISEWVYKITHGSIFIDLDFSWEEIIIKSDFLDVSEANKIPLFRRVSEISFQGLNLTNIKLDNNKLYFYFSCPVSLYSPLKIWDVLCEICYLADKHDEEFCEEYGAKQLNEQKIKEIPLKNREIIYKNFKEIISTNLEIIKDLEDRRRWDWAWDVISTTYKMIDYSCGVKWVLALKIWEKVSELYDKNESLDTIIFRWKEFLKELLDISFEDFSKSVYEDEEFIPNKRVSNNEYISEYLRPGGQDAWNALQNGDSEGSYLIFMHILYNSMYYHVMPYGMEKTIVSAIKMWSDKKVDSKSVWNLSNKVYEIVQGKNISSSNSGFWFMIWAAIMWFINLFISG